MSNYEDAIKLLEQIKDIAIEVKDDRKQQLIEYIIETVWKYEDMSNS